MSSTLRPGKTSEAIASLRDKALSELDKPEEGRLADIGLSFDVTHDGQNRDVDTDDNGVSQYSGQNSEHIGNGSGGAQ